MNSRTGAPDSPEFTLGHILVVDDDPEIRRLLGQMLRPAGYLVHEYATAAEGVAAIRTDCPDVVLLDLDLPDRSGHDVLEEIRSDPVTRLLPVVMLTGHAERHQKIRALRQGVTDFIAKPFAPEELLPRVRSLVTLKQFADEFEHAERVILTLARTIDARDPHTAGHSGRVAEYADRLALRMGLDTAARSEMRRGALFHDIGKIVIPDSILRKPGILTAEERVVIEQHPAMGQELLSPMLTMRKILPVVSGHHERLDGSGYPAGLSGSEIPTPVRIVTVADIYDALTSDRPYRPARTREAAFEILADGVEKGWWDGDVVRELRAAAAAAELPVRGAGE